MCPRHRRVTVGDSRLTCWGRINELVFFHFFFFLFFHSVLLADGRPPALLPCWTLSCGFFFVFFFCVVIDRVPINRLRRRSTVLTFLSRSFHPVRLLDFLLNGPFPWRWGVYLAFPPTQVLLSIVTVDLRPRPKGQQKAGWGHSGGERPLTFGR